VRSVKIGLLRKLVFQNWFIKKVSVSIKKSSDFFPSYFFFCPLFFLFSILPEMYLKSQALNHIMTRCLFCGVYCEVKCGVYCEGYPGGQGEKEGGTEVLGCTQIGISYICENCLKDLKQALESI
jgi:hypothetical protein